jgi:hypothetical protein
MLLAAIAAWSLIAFGFLLFVVQLVAHEIGFWFGRRRAGSGDVASEGVGTVVIVDIIDLAAARLGTFRASVAAYQWTLQSFQGGVTIPPPPSR